MTTTTAHRLYFGEWLDAYNGNDPSIADLRDDFRRSLRLRKLTPLDYKTPRRVYLDIRCWFGCSDAVEALWVAADLYAKEPNSYPNTWADLAQPQNA